MVRRSIVVLLVSGAVAFAQQGDLKQRTAPDIPSDSVQVAAGTHILLRMMNSVSTRQTQVGDRIYLETAYPVFDSGRLLIPQGSWVMGTVTSVTRPKRVKGAGELQVRFDSLTFPNGVSRNFHSGLGAASGTGNEKVDHEKSTVKSDRDKGDDVAHTVERTADGAALGTVIGAASGHLAEGAGLGAAGGLATGLAGVLLSRRPDAVLPAGSTVEMILDRPLVYKASELPVK